MVINSSYNRELKNKKICIFLISLSYNKVKQQFVNIPVIKTKVNLQKKLLKNRHIYP